MTLTKTELAQLLANNPGKKYYSPSMYEGEYCVFEPDSDTPFMFYPTSTEYAKPMKLVWSFTEWEEVTSTKQITLSLWTCWDSLRAEWVDPKPYEEGQVFKYTYRHERFSKHHQIPNSTYTIEVSDG